MSGSGRVLLVGGPRAAERLLLDEIERALPPGSAPSRPVRVVVPSRALRTHLAGRLLERRKAWLGVEISTLAAAAAAVGGADPGAPSIAPEPVERLLTARLASSQPALADALGGLARGYDEARAAVRDLVDAGLSALHIEAVEERLELESGPAVDRARALARVAAALEGELAALGLAPGAERFAAAERRLAALGPEAWPSAAILLHGFHDATGVATDFLAGLVRHADATVVWSRPPDLDGHPTESIFGGRLLERLVAAARTAVESAGGDAMSAVTVSTAPSPRLELRAAAAWLLREGPETPAERTALVVREGADDLATAALELDRMGGAGSSAAGRPAPLGRRAGLFLELLDERERARVGAAIRFAAESLAAATGLPSAALRSAAAGCGWRRLLDLRPERSRPVDLPGSERLVARDDGGGVVRARRIAPDTLDLLARRLIGLREDLAGFAGRRPWRAWRDEVTALLRRFVPESDAAALVRALEAVGDGADDLELEAAELGTFLAGAWQEIGREEVGGGAGIALLSVTEARALTFERIAVVGLTRDRFPRPVRPDPLLPDALRLRLREVLPDLPVKGEGHEEERFLFAQLVDSAPELLLLRPVADADGRALSPSPLLDELARAGRAAAPEPASAPRSAFDTAIAEGLDGATLDFARLEAVLAEARDRFGGLGEGPLGPVARARAAALAEHEVPPGSPRGRSLGPFLGRLGAAVADDDPRRRPAWVTTLERFAGCGWQVLLERILRLAPPFEPEQELPELPGYLAGTLVHRTMDALVDEGRRGGELAVRLDGEPRPAEWPGDEALEARVAELARRLLVDEGLDPSLFGRALTLEALGFLAVARELDAGAAGPGLLGVEVDGEAVVPLGGGELRLPFRVDRLEVDADGIVIATDFKTGRPLSDGKKPETRLRALARRIARGRALQPVAYLLALSGRPARARYLQLAPDLDPGAREIAFGPDELAAQPIGPVLGTLESAWSRGLFVPRLVDASGDPWDGCAFCAVREACLQGDSGARGRLARWAEAEAPADPEARAWWALDAGLELAGGEEEAG